MYQGSPPITGSTLQGQHWLVMNFQEYGHTGTQAPILMVMEYVQKLLVYFIP